MADETRTSDRGGTVRMAPDEFVDRLVTDAERAQIVERLSVLNGGRTDGIQLRDAFAIMYDSDAMLAKTEAAADEWRRLWPGVAWTPAHSMVVYVLSMLDQSTTAENVRRFMYRVLVRFDDDGYAVVLATTRDLLREIEARMLTTPKFADLNVRAVRAICRDALAGALPDDVLDYSTVDEGRL
jgi:hypothetical protein